MRSIIFVVALMLMIVPASGYQCWKGLNETEKEGQYGTMQENGFVPDSVTVACKEYQTWTAAQPTPAAEYEEKLVATTGLDPTTQAAISAITGAGAAYLIVRRKKAA